MKKRLTCLLATLALVMGTCTLALGGQPAKGPRNPRSDNLKHSNGAKQFGLRQAGLKAKLNGKAAGRVHQVARGQYVELEQTRSDRIFVILAEFGTEVHPTYGGAPGPAHNEIAEPDRSVDNSTIWQADYNRAHYEDLRPFRYSTTGTTTGRR